MSGILFYKDWEKYPNAIIDTKTKNKTFLEMSYKLKSAGVKNHAFMLALHNPRLLGVDPFDPHLSAEMMTLIVVECSQNFWYGVRNIWMAPAIAGVGGSLVSLNRGNLSLWWSFLNHITYVLVQPRQTGKSFSTDILMSELLNFLCFNSQFNLLTKDDTLRIANVERLKAIYDELPPYLKFKVRGDSNNTTDITINQRGNVYYTHVPQSSEKGAYKLGRGLTSPVIQIDEGPFQPHIGIAMGSALGAMGAACELAAKKGEPYGVVVTTTAGKQDDPSGRYIYDFAMDAALWSDHYYDCEGPKELEAMVRANSPAGVYRIYGCFSHRQVGKSDAWLLENLERTNQSKDDANRDYFNIWTRGNEASPFDPEMLKKINGSRNGEHSTEVQSVGSYVLRWHIPKENIAAYKKNSKCLINLDTSDASGRDDIGVTIIDAESGGVVAAGNYNETNLIVFAKFCLELLCQFEGSTMIFERRSSAIVIIDYLLILLPERGMDPFRRLFNWVVNDPIEHESLWREASEPVNRRPESLYVRAKKYFGFATSGSGRTSRDELYSTTLTNALNRSADLIRDPVLIDQINGLVIRRGRIDHADGKKDDLVISFLMGHWLLSMGKNLAHYGLDPRKVLVRKVSMKEMSHADAQIHMEQQKLRQDIPVIIAQLEQVYDPIIMERLAAQLRAMERRLILEEGESFSLDAILNKIRDDRALRRRTNYLNYMS